MKNIEQKPSDEEVYEEGSSQESATADVVEIEEAGEGKQETFKPVTDADLEYLKREIDENRGNKSISWDKRLRGYVESLREEGDEEEASSLENINKRRVEEAKSLALPFSGIDASSLSDYRFRKRHTLSQMEAMREEAEEWLALPVEEKVKHEQRKEKLYFLDKEESEETMNMYRDSVERYEKSLRPKIEALEKSIGYEKQDRGNRAEHIIDDQLRRAGVISGSHQEGWSIDMKADLTPVVESLNKSRGPESVEKEFSLEEVEEARKYLFNKFEGSKEEAAQAEIATEREKIDQTTEREQRRLVLRLKNGGIITRAPGKEYDSVDMDADLSPFAESSGISVEKLEDARKKAFEASEEARKALGPEEAPEEPHAQEPEPKKRGFLSRLRGK